MTNTKRLIHSSSLFTLCLIIILGAWAVEGDDNNQIVPQDFDPSNPAQIPDPSNFDFSIVGITDPGQILMIEGLENETIVLNEGGELVAGDTRIPRLIVHGVFDEDIRNWREEIMNGELTKRDIDIILLDSQGNRRLLIELFEAWPATFSFPVLAVDGSTRYLERVEFVYDDFNIRD